MLRDVVVEPTVGDDCVEEAEDGLLLDIVVAVPTVGDVWLTDDVGAAVDVAESDNVELLRVEEVATADVFGVVSGYKITSRKTFIWCAQSCRTFRIKNLLYNWKHF